MITITLLANWKNRMRPKSNFPIFLKKSTPHILLSLSFLLLITAKAVQAQHNDKWLFPERGDLETDHTAMPFYPHRAQTNTGEVLKKEDFSGSEVCGACHTDIYQQWQESIMSKSWDDPIYRALLAKASIATDGKVDNFCSGCHTPIGLTTGHINRKSVRTQPAEETEAEKLPNVDCESCHNMVSRTGKDNGAYLLHPRSKGGKPTKFGPRKQAQSPFHETVYSEFHTRSDFCSTCHNVTHPFNSTAIERTYDEWQESPYSVEDISCQDCHMKRYKGKAAIMGPERDDIASHYFVGANVTLHKYFGDHKAAERARQLLRSAGEIEIIDADNITAGSTAKVMVKVTNTNTGHKLPTGFPEGREVWIDFKVTDSKGDVIYHLGKIEDGHTEKGTKNFKVTLGDKDGNIVDLNVWEVSRVLKDNRILPKGYEIAEFMFPLPQEITGDIHIHAKLNYWSFPQQIVDLLLGVDEMKVEITEIDSTKLTVPVDKKQLAQSIN